MHVPVEDQNEVSQTASTVAIVGISSPVSRSPNEVLSPATRSPPTTPKSTPNFPGSDIALISRFGTKMFEAYFSMAEDMHQQIAASCNVQQQLNLKKENERLNAELEAKSTEIVDYEKKFNDLKQEKEDLTKCLEESKKMLEETTRNINEMKQKQWCANCNQEAVYICCWNTSYCADYCCRQSHWFIHKDSCSRASNGQH